MDKYDAMAAKIVEEWMIGKNSPEFLIAATLRQVGEGEGKLREAEKTFRENIGRIIVAFDSGRGSEAKHILVQILAGLPPAPAAEPKPGHCQFHRYHPANACPECAPKAGAEPKKLKFFCNHGKIDCPTCCPPPSNREGGA